MKTKQQRMVMRKWKLNPLFWTVDEDKETYMVVHNWLIGGYRLLRK